MMKRTTMSLLIMVLLVTFMISPANATGWSFTCNNITSPVKNQAFYVYGPSIFVGSIFVTAFVIGHNHWLKCKTMYPYSKDSNPDNVANRGVCQAEWNWPQNQIHDLLSR